MLKTAPLALLAALLAALTLAAPVSAKTQSCAGTAQPQSEWPEQSKSATLLFIPGPVRTPQPALTADLEQLPGFSVGLFSPTLGRYSPTQMMLDISQGARVASSLYKPVIAPPPGLVTNDVGLKADAGHYSGWAKLVARADAVPGEIIPGLFACAVTGAGKHVTWIPFAGSPTVTGVAAADTRGQIQSLVLPPQADQAVELAKAQKYADFVVGTLPPGGPGFGIARQLAKSEPDRLILIVQAPPDPARTRLLTIAGRNLEGEGGGLRSATTRRDGLVAATDVAPTILERLGIDPPSEIQGQPIVAAPRMSAEELNAMNDRLSLVAGRRAPLGKSVLVLGGLVVIFLLLAGRMTGRYAETSRLVARVVGLALLWLPVALLITAAMRPSRALEADIAVFGCLLLGFITDRLVRWPRALWVPALAALLAHGIDFAVLDAKYTGESLLGSNPLYGARFFGVGNELEVVLSVSTVMGLGAFMCDRSIKRPAWWFAVGGAILAIFLGAGRLGADVGGVIFAAAAFGVAAVYVAKMRFTPLRVALLIAIPVIGLVLIGALDAVSGGESHLTRTVFEAQSFGDLWDVADRRFRASVEGAKADGIWLFVIASVLLLLWAWFKRERLFSPLVAPGEDAAARRPLRAGLVGGLAGTIVGALANDSGPAILIIGTIYLCMGLLYLRGRPISA